MDSGSITWVLISALLVWIMSPGLALFYAGLGGPKNRLHTIGTSLILMGVASIIWFLLGYTLAFGGGNDWLGNLKFWGLNQISFSHSTRGLAIPDGLFAIFQGMFPIITVIIIIGSVIGRIRLRALIVFISVWLLVVYSPLAHMVWDNGFLAKLGAIDFAGGTVVHISSGVTGLVLAYLIGPRRDQSYEKIYSPYIFVGGFLLWFGWFGFNAGSALAANDQAILALMNTWLASAAALLPGAWMSYRLRGHLLLADLVTAGLSGLVVITPAAGFVHPWAAIVMGIIAGVVGIYSITLIKHHFGYDDTLDAFGIHGIGGTLGAILTGVFADKSLGNAGGLVNGHWELLGQQLIAIVITLLLVVVGTVLLAGITRLLVGPLRVSEDDETIGLDLRLHLQK